MNSFAESVTAASIVTRVENVRKHCEEGRQKTPLLVACTVMLARIWPLQ